MTNDHFTLELVSYLSKLSLNFKFFLYIETKKEAVSQLQTQRALNMSHYKQMGDKLFELKSNLDQFQDEYDDAMATDTDKVSSKHRRTCTLEEVYKYGTSFVKCLIWRSLYVILLSD